MIEKHLVFFFKTSYNGSIVCELKPVDRAKGVKRKAKLIEFLIRNIVDECIKAKVES